MSGEAIAILGIIVLFVAIGVGALQEFFKLLDEKRKSENELS